VLETDLPIEQLEKDYYRGGYGKLFSKKKNARLKTSVC
jgi:hypothetical protein